MNDLVNVKVGGVQDVIRALQNYNTIILKPNIVDNRNVLTQDMINEKHTKYIIKWNYILEGATINVPEDCIIEFSGGTIDNGVIVGNNTRLIYSKPIDEICKAERQGTWIYDTSVADEEDITSVEGHLKFKDRPADDGMGKIILRKNKSFANQVTQSNTIYVIQYDFDLNGEEITIPANCVLEFDGGSVNNGIIGVPPNTKIFNGKSYDVQYRLQAGDVVIKDTYIENDTMGTPIISWTPGSNILIEGCTIINRSPNPPEQPTGSTYRNGIFFSIKQDIKNVVIRNNYISARAINVEMYTYSPSEGEPAVSSNFVVEGNVIVQQEIDDVSDINNACWPISFSGNINNSIVTGNRIKGGYFGIEIVACRDVSIENNSITGTVQEALNLSGSSKAINWINNQIYDCGLGFRNAGQDTFLLKNNTFINTHCSIGGIYSQVINNTFIETRCVLGGTYNVLDGNIFQNSENDKLLVIPANKAIIRNNVVISDLINCILVNNQGVDVTFINNHIIGNGIPNYRTSAVIDYTIDNGVIKRKTYQSDELPNNIGAGASLIIMDNGYPYPFWKIGNNFYKADGTGLGTIDGGPTASRPDAIHIIRKRNFVYFDTDLNKPIFPKNIYSSTGRVNWVEADGAAAGVVRSGTFAEKPASANIYVGFAYFCTDKQTTEGATDGIMIYHKGSDVWVDALGRVVS